MPLSTDPIDFALDPATGDLVIPARFSRGLEAAVQQARICMLACRGEWFLDLDNGVPYLERDGVPAEEALLGQKFDANKATAMMRNALANASLIVEVISLNVTFDRAARAMTVRWEGRTSFGDLVSDDLDLEA